jgi:dephospho-CoA kinase
MRLIGVTGILGSGKTTVSGLLKKAGFRVIDLDLLSRLVAERGDVVMEIEEAFGPGVVSEGRLDREGLRDAAFQNDAALRRLEGIIHPRVQAELFEESARLEKEGVGTLIVDGPLLFETGLNGLLDRVVVVSTSAERLRERLKRRGMDAEDIERRLSFQIPLEEKEGWADHVVWNNGTEEDLKGEVETLIRKIRDWEVG